MFIRKINCIANKIKLSFIDNTREIEPQFTLYGFITLGGFLFFWIFNSQFLSSDSYENIFLRCIAMILCLLLIFRKKWPKSLQKYLPAFWNFTLLYNSPFFFTYMFLKNGGTTDWQLNGLVSFSIIIFLTNWITLAVIIPLGVLCGYTIYYFTCPQIILPGNIFNIISCYLTILIHCAVFSYRKEKIHAEKLESIKALSAAIGHELHTPLRAMDACVSGLNDYIKILTDGYIQARKAHLPVEEIHPKHLQKIPTLLQTVEQESEHAFNILDMMLVKLKDTPSPENLEECSALVCIETALKRYPFIGNDRELITVDPTHDFTFQGKELLIVHILFNLMKNALHYIKKAKKGKIHIWMTVKGKTNTLHFKDTGTGIHQKDLPYIFEEFYSRTNHGTGIGLAFCKNVMLSIEGNITCQSIYGQYSIFSLHFSKKDEKINKKRV